MACRPVLYSKYGLLTTLEIQLTHVHVSIRSMLLRPFVSPMSRVVVELSTVYAVFVSLYSIIYFQQYMYREN